MAEQQDHSSMGPLNATAGKEGWPLIGLILLAMVATVVGLFVAGNIANAL